MQETHKATRALADREGRVGGFLALLPHYCHLSIPKHLQLLPVFVLEVQETDVLQTSEN